MRKAYGITNNKNASFIRRLDVMSIERTINVIGIFGVIGSLIFVGLQMDQSQKIALAAQQQARTEVLIEIIGGFDEGDSSFVEYMHGIV